MVTVADLLGTENLTLTCVAGHAGLGRVVTGAHSSEHPDPSPWLNGGEVLMTTGMRVRRKADWEALVAHLDRRGITALGLGVGPGLTHEHVPRFLPALADSVSLPLLEVPVTTPFTAITEAVYLSIAAEQEASAARAFTAQRRLTTVAVQSPGLSEIAEELADMVHGWVLIFDTAGRLLYRSERAGRVDINDLMVEVNRVQGSGLRSSASMSLTPEWFCAYLVPLGAQELAGVLVCGEPGQRVSTFTRHCATSAASLMSLELENRCRIAAAERRPRAVAVGRLLQGLPHKRAVEELRALGWGDDLVQVLLVASAEGDGLTESVYRERGDALICRHGTELALIVGHNDKSLIDCAVHHHAGAHAGLGAFVSPESLPTSLRQAQAALTLALRRGSHLVHAAELGHLDFLLRLRAPAAMAAYADAVLDPIEREAGRDARRLIHALRIFLECDGVADTAAKRLGVHRNTLRAHLSRIEEMTHRRTTCLVDQVELWTALQIRDLRREPPPEASPGPSQGP